VSDIPTLRLDTDTGEVHIDWDGDRPREVVMAVEMFEDLVEFRNRLTREVKRVQELEQTVRDQESFLKRMRDVLSLVRMGRRPSYDTWRSIGIATITPDARKRLAAVYGEMSYPPGTINI
jgi:hypothetical protein